MPGRGGRVTKLRVIQPHLDCSSAKDFLDALSPLGPYFAESEPRAVRDTQEEALRRGFSRITRELRGLGAEVVGLTTEFPEEGDNLINFAARRRAQISFRLGEREALLELLAERTSIPQILVFNQNAYITGRLIGYYKEV